MGNHLQIKISYQSITAFYYQA